MSKDNKIRLRFDRLFKPGTPLAKVAQYLERFSQDGTDTKADQIQEWLCIRYLPFTFDDFQDKEAQLVAVRSIYALETVIREILVLWDIPDPRIASGDAARMPCSSVQGESFEPVNDISVEAPSNLSAESPLDLSAEAPLDLGADDTDDDDTAFLEGTRSTVSRMLI
ncbi:MAG: hypothetical protein AAGD25_15225 [Cyanobacteria bacterium P01_F01_bin.150]